MIGSDAFQEIDTYGLTIPITKHNWLVRSAAELLDVIPEAFRVAASAGRPVVVDVPKDDAERGESSCAACRIPAVPTHRRSTAPPSRARPSCRRRAPPIPADRRGCDRGGCEPISCGRSRSGRRPRRIHAARSRRDADGHPLALGMVGMHGAPYVNHLLEECDLLFAVGMLRRPRDGKGLGFCPNARIVHVDIDASELGKIRTPLVAVRADAGLALAELLPQTAPKRRVACARRRAARVGAARDAGADDPTTPYGIMRAAAELAGDDAIVTTDVGQHQMWVAQAYPFRRPRQLPDVGRARHDGLRSAGRDRCGARGTGSSGAVLHRRRQPADEPAGAGDRRRGAGERQDHPAQQRTPGPRPPAAAAVLRRPLPGVALPRRARLRGSGARVRDRVDASRRRVRSRRDALARALETPARAWSTCRSSASATCTRWCRPVRPTATC